MVTIKGPDRSQIVKVFDEKIDLNVQIAGNGPAIVYLHPAGGLYWDEFLDKLAETHTVYAPELPGTTLDDPYAVYKFETYWELVLIYEEALHKLGLEKPSVIGQSMGGMMALDLASHFRGIFDKVVVLDPVGIWTEDAPNALPDLYVAPPEKIPGMLFHNPEHPGAQAMFALPEDPELIPKAISRRVWALGCAGKFLWPLADTGLARRIHRMDNETLIIWGRHDKLVPVALAAEFDRLIKNSRVEIIEDCGHIPEIEKLDETYGLVSKFIN